MDDEEYRKHLMKFKKTEIIDFYFRKDFEKKQMEKDLKVKYEKKSLGQVKKIKKLQKYISKFREIEDKYNIKKGTYVFIEYRSELSDVRTCVGLFIGESKSQIKIQIKDEKGYYYYHIKKKLINGMKEYRTQK